MKRWSFILAVILIISFCFAGCQNQQMLSVEEYNAKYAKTIDFEKGIDDKTFGNADYRVFLAGEYHAQTKGYQTQKMLIQYFHEEQDVDYLICELGMGQGFLLDDYIQTGNEENLIFMMEELEGTLAYTQDEYQLWKWLYDYNQQQPENDKLHIIGLDIEFQKKTSVRGLSLLMDNSVTPAKEIQPLIERIKESDGTAVKEFPQALEKYPEQMKEVFGENFPWAEQYAKNVTATEKFFELNQSGGANAHQIRDDKMTDNLFFAMEQLPEDAKFFGQFGAEHILQSEMITTFVLQENYNRFAMQLQADDSPVKGEVCSIYLAFLKKSQSPRSTTYYPINESEIPVDSFQDYYAQDTFIPLDEKGSPFFNNGEEQTENKENANAKAEINLTDYFQKILLLPDSEACEPYQQS
ncbi:MAG: erythromycin esterase family protein [Negativibacillus massiliensis]|nr:erythromycin esterase family protein [Negativibacillus massiliensis]